MNEKTHKTLNELANAIAVRNHVMTIINGPRGAATKDEVARLRNFVADVDKQVMLGVLALDAPEVSEKVSEEVSAKASQPSKKDLDMKAAQAKMEREKKAAATRSKLMSEPAELSKPAEEKQERAKQDEAKTAEKKQAPTRKGVVQRILD